MKKPVHTARAAICRRRGKRRLMHGEGQPPGAEFEVKTPSPAYLDRYGVLVVE